MLTAIQLVLLIFIVFFLSRVYLRVREKVITVKTAVFWTLVWLVALIGILLPGTTTKIASIFGVGRGVDVILYLAISLLFYLVFRIYVVLEDLKREITKVIRMVALLDNAAPKPRGKDKKSS
jgi:hypothetical protein